jgi:hypothetical protein
VGVVPQDEISGEGVPEVVAVAVAVELGVAVGVRVAVETGVVEGVPVGVALSTGVSVGNTGRTGCLSGSQAEDKESKRIAAKIQRIEKTRVFIFHLLQQVPGAFLTHKGLLNNVLGRSIIPKFFIFFPAAGKAPPGGLSSAPLIKGR